MASLIFSTLVVLLYFKYPTPLKTSTFKSIFKICLQLHWAPHTTPPHITTNLTTLPTATMFSSHKAEKRTEPADIPPEISDLHCFTETNGVITTTMFDIPGYKVVRVLGAVYGITVRSRNWAAGLGMVAKSVVGGELKWFTSMVSFGFQSPNYK